MIRNARTGEVGEELLLRWKVAVTYPVTFSPLLFLSLARGTLLNPYASTPSHLRNIYQLACQSAGFNTSLEVVLHVCSPKRKPQGMSAIAASHWNLSDHVSILQGSFVAAFASSNLGDVSPNTKGPFCVNTGESCDNPQSTCPVGGVRMDYLIYTKLWWRRKIQARAANTEPCDGPFCMKKTSSGLFWMPFSETYRVLSSHRFLIIQPKSIFVSLQSLVLQSGAQILDG